MSSDVIIGEKLTASQEASVVYALGENPDAWLTLLDHYVASQGKRSDELKTGLIENNEAWKTLVAESQKRGFGELRALASQKPFQWNVRLRQLLSDLGHANLLSFYFRALVGLKGQRITEVSQRAAARMRINAVLSAIASDALGCLDKYRDATATLGRRTTQTGRLISPDAMRFFESAHAETMTRVSALLAVIVIFRDVSNSEDIKVLQQFIKGSLIQPLEARLPGLAEMEARKAREKIADYNRLTRSVEISFD
jgi:hypothetical protein